MKDWQGHKCVDCSKAVYGTMTVEDEFYEYVTCYRCGNRRERFEFRDGIDSPGIWPR